jgi:tetratricopeptide (TPR) repeat protein
MMRRSWLAAGLAVAALGAAAPARADNKADILFNRGKQELAAKHYEAACRDFRASLDADPSAIGTMVNLARCYESWGRLATGLSYYKDAEAAAEKVHDSRASQIAARIKALDPQVPRLTVHVRGAVAGIALQLDGKPIDVDQIGKELLVDPGPHVVAVVRGTDRRERTVPVEPGGSSEVQLDAPAQQDTGAARATTNTSGTTSSGAATTTTTTTTTATAGVAASSGAPDPRHGRRVLATVAGAAGAVAMLAAGGVTLRAKSRYDAALKGDCDGDRETCDAEGVSATGSARKEANVATGIFAGGAALAVAGGVLFFMSRSSGDSREHAMRVVPTIGDGPGLALVGAF